MPGARSVALLMKVFAPVTSISFRADASIDAIGIGWPGTSFMYATSDVMPYDLLQIYEIIIEPVELFGTEIVGVHAAPRSRENDLPRLDQVDQPGDLLFVFWQNRRRFLLTLEPFVDLPNAFDRPAEILVRFGNADDLVDVPAARSRIAFGGSTNPKS